MCSAVVSSARKQRSISQHLAYRVASEIEENRNKRIMAENGGGIVACQRGEWQKALMAWLVMTA